MLPHSVQICECHVDNTALHDISYCNLRKTKRKETNTFYMQFMCASQNTA